MKRLTKLAILSAMSFASCAAVVVATISFPDSFESVYAAECAHEGNHYSLLVPTKTNTGTKEYWVCCKCHEHFISKPSGTWDYAGTAMTITDTSDNRYIAKITGTTGYTDAQGLTYSTDGKTVTKYTAKTGITDIVVPEGVTSVGTVFNGKTNITSVTLPDSVTEVGQGCFQGCTKLQTVKIGANTEKIETKYSPNATTKYSLGAFQSCSSLQYLIIPASVIEIVPYTFRDANSKCILYCEVASKPSGWIINTPKSGDDWNVYSNSSSKPKLKTYWLGEWYLDADGIPHPNN